MTPDIVNVSLHHKPCNAFCRKIIQTQRNQQKHSITILHQYSSKSHSTAVVKHPSEQETKTPTENPRQIEKENTASRWQ